MLLQRNLDNNKQISESTLFLRLSNSFVRTRKWQGDAKDLASKIYNFTQVVQNGTLKEIRTKTNSMISSINTNDSQAFASLTVGKRFEGAKSKYEKINILVEGIIKRVNSFSDD